MINGRFSDDDTLIFELSLMASDGLEFPTDVMLDTGFSGWLAIDEQDLEGLDWTYLRTIVQQTARGVSDFDIYAGKVRLEASEFDILVHVGEGLTETSLFQTAIVRELPTPRIYPFSMSSGEETPPNSRSIEREIDKTSTFFNTSFSPKIKALSGFFL